jgi:hypothetical protein
MATVRAEPGRETWATSAALIWSQNGTHHLNLDTKCLVCSKRRICVGSEYGGALALGHG